MKQAIVGVVVGAAVVGGIWFFAGQDKTIASVGSDKITQQDFYNKLEKSSSAKDNLHTLIDNIVIQHQAKALGIEAVGPVTMSDANKDVTISDQEIKDYYDKNKETMGEQEQLKARHILVKDEAKAKDLFAKLQANPNDFEKLAKENSEDPGSKDKGGMLEPFGKGVMVPEFEKAAFAAKVNDIIGPVKSEFGYHIIQVLEQKQAKVPTLDEVKDKITKTLKQQKAKPMQDLMNELYAKEKITINKDGYKDILNPPTPQAPASGGTGAGTGSGATTGTGTTDGAATPSK